MESVEEYKQARSGVDVPDDPEAIWWMLIAEIYILRRAKIEQALTLLDEARALYRNLGDEAGLADTFFRSGNLNHSVGRKATAMEQWGESLRIYERIGDRKHRADTLVKVGDCCRWHGDYPGAIVRWREASLLYQHLGYAEEAADVETSIAGAAMRSASGDPVEQAEKWADFCISFSKTKQGETPGLWTDRLTSVASYDILHGDLSRAGVILALSLAVDEATADRDDLSETHARLARLASREDDPGEALQHLDESVARGSDDDCTDDDSWMSAQQRYQRADLLFQLGRETEAIESLMKGVESYCSGGGDDLWECSEVETIAERLAAQGRPRGLSSVPQCDSGRVAALETAVRGGAQAAAQQAVLLA